MLKIEINEANTKLEVSGKGRVVLMEGILPVYMMAKHFYDKNPALAEIYRKLLADALTDDNFFELVNSGEKIVPDADGVEDDTLVN